MTNQLGPEPTGWELMRGLDGVRKEIEKIGSRVVPLDVYAADRKGADERFQRAEARLRDVEVEKAESKRQQEANAAEAEKLRRQQRFAIALALVSPLLALVIDAIRTGGLL